MAEVTLPLRGSRRFALALALFAASLAPPASAEQASGPAKTRRTAAARSARAAAAARSAGAAVQTGSIRAPVPAVEIAAARSLGNGILRFVPDPPDALIFVNDSAVSGTTIALPPGDYHVRFEAPGRLSASQDARIDTAGQVVGIGARLPFVRASSAALTVIERLPPAVARSTGFLSVQSEPTGATVLLDGDSVGVTPLLRARVQAVEYSLRLSKVGYSDSEQMIRVTAGRDTIMRFLLLRPLRP